MRGIPAHISSPRLKGLGNQEEHLKGETMNKSQKKEIKKYFQEELADLEYHQDRVIGYDDTGKIKEIKKLLKYLG